MRPCHSRLPIGYTYYNALISHPSPVSLRKMTNISGIERIKKDSVARPHLAPLYVEASVVEVLSALTNYFKCHERLLGRADCLLAFLLAYYPCFGGWLPRVLGAYYLLACVNSSVKKVEMQRNSKKKLFEYANGTTRVLCRRYSQRETRCIPTPPHSHVWWFRVCCSCYKECPNCFHLTGKKLGLNMNFSP